jgi:acetyl-CoA carboxylase biotin carboxyl carrier protein
MNLEDIKQILDLVREHDLQEFELERDGLKVRVRKAGHEVVYAAPAPIAPQAAQPAAPSTPAAVPAIPAPVLATAEGGESVNLAVIKSPIVGTFYRSSEPGAAPFVSVGDIVKKGQVLCIIEAMKLMNEIESDADGEVAAVYAENGKPVQFGERLFALKVG